MRISNRARDIQESPIRKLAAIAKSTREKGIDIFHLNIGQPDIPTPDVFYERIRSFSESVLSYGPSDGLEELKEAVVCYFGLHNISLEAEDIVITTAGSEAILFAFSAVGDAGDEIIIPEPFYTNYNGFASLANLKIVPVTTNVEDGFHLPEEQVFRDRISDRTRAIMLCSPNNPTGTVYSKAEISMVARLAQEHDLFLIADEVYKEFIYDGKKHFSIMELPGMEERVIVVDSISKRYSACGARIGALMSKNRTVTGSVLKFAQARLCPPTLEQIGAIGTYCMPTEYFTPILAEYQQRRDVIFERLTANPDIVLQKPEGAFYIMAKLPVSNTEKFARWMLQDFQVNGKTVMVAPGPGFYSSPGKGDQEIRIAYVLKEEKLEQAADILLKAIESFNKIC